MRLCGKIGWRLVGAVPVCPPMSPHKGASIVKFPAHNVCVFGMETPLRERSGGHTGTAPTVPFGRIACECRMAFGQIAHGMVDFVWRIACGRLVAFGWMMRECRMAFGGLCMMLVRVV